MEKKNYSVSVTVYHMFDVEADSAEDAKEKASEIIWDDEINHFTVEVKEIAQ